MATAEQLASLRLLIAEPDETDYTEDSLAARIDEAEGNLDRVAYNIWTEKAAKYTALVDKSEGGSSRANGQLMEKALKMVDLFKKRLDDAATEPDGPGPAVTRLHRLRR